MKAMQKGSIKVRITLWYAALLTAVCLAALMVLIIVSERAADMYSRDTLYSAATVIIDELDVEEGELEIDSDIDEVPGVYASLFEMDGTLLYGRARVDMPFEDNALRKAKDGANSWIVHDRLLHIEDRDSVWLRLYLADNAHENMLYALLSSGAWLLPILVALALLGGYLITEKAFHPVKEMSTLAASIANGRDLSGRVHLDAGSRDELYALGGTLNGMLARLEDSFARESRFVSDAAHELRTPLNAIGMQAEYALGCEGAREKDEAIGKILERNEEMRRLVDQLLMIARMDAGEIVLEEKCDLAEIAARVAQDMEIVANEREIRLETEIEPCEVIGNSPMLMRVLINLTDNAIRYGKEGGYVRITLRRQAQRAVLCVQDNGMGMDEAALEHVFERFWRADSARRTGGTGIGLSIVQSAVQAHGGEIAVRSRIAEGTCFTITLPLAAQSASGKD